MNIKFSRWALLFVFVLLLVADPIFAQSSNLPLKNLFEAGNESTSGTNLVNGTVQITQWVFWIFYLLGAIFMGVGAFKLKQGDIAGFGKNMAGGATLFFVPAIIKLFKGLGNTAVGS